MLTLYLACLISGAILLAISMFSGGDADHGVDHAVDAHADLDHSLDAHVDVSHDLAAHGDMAPAALDHGVDAHGALDHGVDAHGSLPADADHGAMVQDTHGSALSAAFQFFSFRNIVYLTTFFGLTGSVLTWLGTAAFITLLSAGGMGAFAMMVGHKFMQYLKTSETGQGYHERDFVGHVCKVALSPSKTRKGKIRISIGGQNIVLVAIVHPDSEREEFGYGEHALILDIEKNTAFIDVADFADETA